MRYYLDTEFIECAKQRKVLGIKVGAPVPTIDLISIALVAEDGRELYLLNADCELQYAWDNEWVRKNVLHAIWNEYVTPGMKYMQFMDFSLETMRRIFKSKGLHKPALSYALLTFVHNEAYEGWVGSADSFFEAPFTDKHSFYGYYCDYDWVVFCQLFGRMIDLPKGFPMYCIDLKQELDRLGITSEQKQALCPDPVNEHNALADARWNKKLHGVLERGYATTE
jgi:hypothetical protein